MIKCTLPLKTFPSTTTPGPTYKRYAIDHINSPNNKKKTCSTGRRASYHFMFAFHQISGMALLHPESSGANTLICK